MSRGMIKKVDTWKIHTLSNAAEQARTFRSSSERNKADWNMAPCNSVQDKTEALHVTVHVCGSHRITIEKILASSERAQNVLAVWTNNACKHRNESLPPSTWLTCPSYRIRIGMSVTHFQRIVLCTHTWHVSVYAIAQRPSSYATVHTLPPVVQCRAMGHH